MKSFENESEKSREFEGWPSRGKKKQKQEVRNMV